MIVILTTVLTSVVLVSVGLGVSSYFTLRG
jgi:hypothetical protein